MATMSAENIKVCFILFTVTGTVTYVQMSHYANDHKHNEFRSFYFTELVPNVSFADVYHYGPGRLNVR